MSDELNEKRRKLAFLEKIIPDNEELLSIELKNIALLPRTVTIREAHEMYLRGEATLEEYKLYDTARSGIEWTREHYAEHWAQVASMKQEAEELKSEIAKIEKEIQREEKKKRRTEFMKKIFGR